MIKNKIANSFSKTSNATKPAAGYLRVCQLAESIFENAETAKRQRKICKYFAELVQDAQSALEIYKPNEANFQGAYDHYYQALKGIDEYVREANILAPFDDMLLNKMSQLCASVAAKQRQNSLKDKLYYALDEFNFNIILAEANMLNAIKRHLLKEKCAASKKETLADVSFPLRYPSSELSFQDIEEGIELHQRKRYKEAFAHFNEHSKTGNNVAQFFVGFYLLTGTYAVAKDENLSRAYLCAAADQGLVPAQFWYAYASVNGKFNEKDIALDNVIKAAQQNDPYALFWYGTILYRGRYGAKKELAKCQDMFETAKECGNPLADGRLKYLRKREEGN